MGGESPGIYLIYCKVGTVQTRKCMLHTCMHVKSLTEGLLLVKSGQFQYQSNQVIDNNEATVTLKKDKRGEVLYKTRVA